MGFAYEQLKSHTTPGAEVIEVKPGTRRLEIPLGPGGAYRLAQLDDYGTLTRSRFPWRPPMQLSLCVRAAAIEIPGTWGFGLWNDPFSMAIRGGGGKMRIPALPNASWFFHASPPNHLSLEDHLPARGWFAATYRSTFRIHPLLWIGAAALPLLAIPPAVRFFRHLARRFIQQDGAEIAASPTAWHTYRLDWEVDCMRFECDSQPILETKVAPRSPLGLVIWMDNTYAAIPPNGRFRYGTLENPEPAWIEVRDLTIRHL
ncbi:MAG: hypothetical protein U9R58_03035 [Chloroflexota bacterium]|nr:hypothetical protein [Chloroflexota bacterium]